MFCHSHRSIVLVTLFSFLVGQVVPVTAYEPQINAQTPAVPSVIGLSAKAAKAELEAAQFDVQFEIGIPAPSADGVYQVYRQTPAAGAKQESGGVVKVTLYDKAAEVPAVTTAGRVPSVTGRSARDAKTALKNAGYTANFEIGNPPPSPELAFKAYQQVPAANEKLGRGQAVRVILYDALAGAGKEHLELASVNSVPSPNISLETVDVGSGTLVSSSMDLVIPAGPTTISLVRYLRNEIGSRGMLGLCWRTNWEKRALHNDRVAVVEEAIGRTVFQLESPGQYRSSFGDQLVFEADKARRLRIDGSQEEFDGQGRLVRVLESGGTEIRVHYDTRGKLTSVDGPFGGFLRFNYDTNGQVNLVTSSTGATVAYTYGPSDEADRDDESFRYQYDASLRLVSSHNPQLATVEYVYDSQNRVVQRRDAAGGIDRYKFDDEKKTVSHTDAVGQVTQFFSHADGRQQGTIDPRGGKMLVERDEAGRPVLMKLKSGRSLEFKYDRIGRLGTMKLGTIGVVEYEYEGATHLPVTVTNRGKRTRFQYDQSQRLTRLAVGEKDPRPLQFSYRPDGLLKSISNGSRVEAEYEYDAQGRRVAETDGHGNVTQIEYDRLGNEIRRRGPLGEDQRREFDRRGRVIGETDSLNNRTTYTYNDRGLLTETTDPLGHVSRAGYSATGQTSEFTAFNGDQAKFEYDAAGRVTTVRRPSGGAMKFEYDSGGDVAKKIDPLGNAQRTEYNAAGRITQRTDAKGQVTRFEYDASGRLLRQIRPDGVEIEHSYDDLGRVVRVDDGKFPVLYQYDARNNVIKLSYPAIKRTLAYQYDELDRLVRFKNSEGREIQYEYDDTDRPRSIKLPGDRSISMTHDARDRLTEVVLPGETKTRLAYDAEDHVTALTWDSPDGNLAGWRYEYDANGRRTRVSDDDGSTVAYAYDPSGQLLQESRGDDSLRFEYGPGGNRVRSHRDGKSFEYKHDAADRLVRAGAESFRYDENGNLVERSGPHGETTYHWNGANQLVQVVLPDGSHVKYGYAPTGERIWREDSTGRTWFVTDGTNVLAELDSQLQSTASYVHLPGIDKPVVMTRGGKEFHLLADERGSIRQVRDAQGQAVATFDYDAFGVTRAGPEKVDCPFGFEGREYDTATGLYYYRARWYDPQLGRFISTDPVPGNITQPLSLHPYAFVWNDPVNLADPLGTKPRPILPGQPGASSFQSAPTPPSQRPTVALRPPLGQQIKTGARSGVAGVGGVGGVAKSGIITGIIWAPVYHYLIEEHIKVTQTPKPDRPHVRATGWGSYLGGLAGGTGGILGGAAAAGLLGLTPVGWGFAAVTTVGMLAGGALGAAVGGTVGGSLVPPGTQGGRERPYKDSRDFTDPSGVTKRPDPPHVLGNMPIFDPKQFVKPGSPGTRTRYAVLAVCSVCSKVHNAGIYTTKEAAQRAANQNFSDPKYRVSIKEIGIANK